MKTSGNVILITGGGSGIGAGLAQRFAAQANRVVIAGRNVDKLAQVAAGQSGIETATVDIGSAADIERFASEIVERFPDLNVLINNAGIMRLETLTSHRDLGDAEATIATNLLGPIRLTNALIDHLQRQADSAIINVTSGLAFVPLASTPTYSATKAAVHSYTVALRHALAGKVEVIELAPPAVQTELTPGQSRRGGYQPLDEFLHEVMDLFAKVPTPTEILVPRVHGLRFAERNGNADELLASVNTTIEKARAAQADS
jgi:uncharacterized oxidoreductase